MTLEQFFEKFELFADAPNAVGKMRELVRHLAVTGKLVAQDPKDESVLALLSRIAAHRAALSKDGKHRGPTTVVPLASEEGDSDIPPSWVWVRFGDVMVNRDGERIPVSKDERATKAKAYDYYGASGVIDKIDHYLFDKPLLLIGEDGANLVNRSTPIAFMARGLYWVNNHAHVLDGISEEFLRYIELHINAINLEPYVTGSAQPKMNQAKMNSIPIALPPLAEQKRIVAKVDELMALCDRLGVQQQERDTRHAALARASLTRFAEAPTPTNLDFLFHQSYPITPADLRKAILSLAVQGQLVGSPKDSSSWPTVRMRDVCIQITDGEHATPQRTSNGVPLATAKNVRDGFLDLSNTDWVATATAEKCWKRCKPRHDDLLMVCVGATTGRVCLVQDPPDMVLVRSVALIRPDQQRIAPTYLNLFLRSPGGQSQIWSNVKQSAQPCLYLGKMSDFEIVLPPLAEQRRIVAKVDQLMALVDQLETQLATSRVTAEKLMEAVVAELTAQV